VALYWCGRDCGCGHGGQGGGQGGGWRTGHQMRKCKYGKMDNHSTKACRKRLLSKNNSNNGDTNTSRNDEQTCQHCGHPGHFMANCIYFKHAWDQDNIVHNGTASIATAGDLDLIWLADNAASLTAASVPAAGVIDSAASHYMSNGCTWLNLI